MSNFPVPVIIVSSSWNPDDMDSTFKAMELGALAVAEKPWGLNHPDFPAISEKLIQTVKLMSEIKVVRRWFARELSKTSSLNLNADLPQNAGDFAEPMKMLKVKIVAIGASTGGAPVLEEILSGLPKGFSLPVLIVQHISTGFLPGFVSWLNQTSNLPVKVAELNELIMPGNAYIAPDSYQMKISSSGRIILSLNKAENGIIPSVSALFKSVAETYGNKSVAILLTGMGRDGAEEMLELKNKGAITIAQDKESSVVHGMPGEAIKLGAARFVFSPGKIVTFLEEYCC